MTTTKLTREIDVIYPIKINGEIKEKFALSPSGELFTIDSNTGTAGTVPVIPSSKNSNPTRVNIGSGSYSFPAIIAENLLISTQEAQAIVKSKYGSGHYPQTYNLQKEGI